MSNRQAIVVPLYKNTLTAREQFSLERTLAVLSENDIYIVGPERLRPYFEGLSRHYGDKLKLQLFANHYFAGIKGYNKLLISEVFYKPFERYEYMLIVQTDALVLENQLAFWCEKGYSYVGAPMFKGFTTPALPLTLFCVGNGGFSLRRVSDFLHVLRQPKVYRNKLMEDWPGNWKSNAYRWLRDYWCFVYKNTQVNVTVNEDLFWGLFVSARFHEFFVPEPDVAIGFAFEAEPSYLFALNSQRLPFGCHAWERYDIEFWQKSILAQGVALPS